MTLTPTASPADWRGEVGLVGEDDRGARGVQGVGHGRELRVGLDVHLGRHQIAPLEKQRLDMIENLV